ncbi:MAG: hypothetical protein JOZ58_04285 [Acetobacteraceae bacterium]|nr:hypothetical protein [Acetobacteraceae bacterium]
MNVTPTGNSTAVKLSSLAANALLVSGGQMQGTLTLASDPVQALQAATKQYVDAQSTSALTKSGGTLTGPLTLAGDPSQPLQPATKQYVDAQTGGLLPKSGGTLSGSLVLSGDPTQPLNPATKQYVDGQTAQLVPKSGGSLTGALTLAADPVQPLQPATKRYVDAQAAASLPLAGGTLNGPMTLPADPVQPLQAATKQYVDTRLLRAGDTMAGPLTLALDPSQPLQAATKNYVDKAVSANGVLNVKSAPYGAKLDGTTDDTAAFQAAYQAAPANSAIYVPAGVAKIQSPSSWGIPISKKVKWIVDGTTAPDGTPLASAIPTGGAPGNTFLPGIVTGNSPSAAEFSQAGSQPTDFAVLHSSYIVGHTGGPTGGVVATNQRSDTIIYNSPNNYIWGGLDRLQWNGTQTPDPNNPAQHVARYIQAIRATAGTDGSGNVLPQPQVWATCVQYVDQTGLPTSKTNAAQGMELDFHANPHFSKGVGASGLRIGESTSATKTCRCAEVLPDADTL